ncbi:MAG: CDP-glycerol glycerophosphotransferase family protein [Bacillota bacterium]|nr:CDP-glycerol glycerophosphotransferase family protein [Bacillota bacterium]
MAPKISVVVPVYNVETYLEDMLKSVKDQTFTDFEVIIVNDGSPDNSQEIIDRFCAEDPRFRSLIKENGGVASARNLALDNARGDYVAFFDSDDKLPETSLEAMYRVAREEMADLVIGLAEIESLDEVHIPQPLIELAAQKEIDKFDFNMNRTFSVWNKLFKRQVIEDNHLRFVPIQHTEDGVFTYQFAHKCNKISGCNSIVYRYVRRVFWESKSLTQLLNVSLINDMLTAFDYMEKAVEESYEISLKDLQDRGLDTPAALEELECKYKEFRSDMYVRFTSVNLIDDFFRFTWKLDQEVIDIITKRILEYKERIFPAMWEEKVVGKNPDLEMHKTIMISTEEMAESPVLSFVISDSVPDDIVGNVVSSMYNQIFPSFEVLLDEKKAGMISDFWKEKPNFHTVKHLDNVSKYKEKALKSVKGRFVMFIDEPVLFSRHIIRRMFNSMSKRSSGGYYDFITVPLVHMNGETSYPIESNSAAYVNELVRIKERSVYNQLDYTWSNKMFYVPYLRGKKVLFTGNTWNDINRLYNNSGYSKRTYLSMATSLDDGDILSKYAKSLRVRMLYKRLLNKDKKITEFIDSQSVRIETRGQRFKNWRLQKIRDGYKFITRKIVYPLYYKINARKPVDPHKVIFIEPRLDKMTNSIMQIYEAFERTGEYEIHEHYLRDRYARYRDQFKRGMAFLKDFATARYGVIAEANETLGCISKRKETVVVNTWHGCGAFKKFGYSTADKLFGGDTKQKDRYPLYHNLDIVTVSSPEIIWAYEEAMHLENKGIVKPIGISRTDVFFDEKFVSDAKDRVIEMFPAAKDKKIILYAPTFRGRIASAAGPDMLDIEKMAKALGDEYVLITKHHPLVKRPPEIPDDLNGIFAIDVTRNSSIDDLICAADICISDYSSLVYEFSLFERPMIFFAYDLEDYFDWRGFYYNYDELAPGPIVTGTEEIIHYIRNIDTMFDKQKVHDFKEKFMSSCDGHSTERIIETMKGM